MIKSLLIFFILFSCTAVSAQTLKAFEKDATKKKSSSSSSSRDKDDDDDDDDDDRRRGKSTRYASSDDDVDYEYGDGWDPYRPFSSGFHVGTRGLMAGFNNSMTWMIPNGRLDPRELGESRTPYARLDIDFQDVDDDIDALGLMAEGGYGTFALYGRQTRFTEDLSAEAGGGEDRLRVTQGYGMVRALLGKHFGFNIGVGQMNVSGEGDNSGTSFTVPIQFRYNEHLGLEFRPAWASINDNTVSEYDVALLGGINHADVKVGWRRLESPKLELDGFYAGFSLRW